MPFDLPSIDNAPVELVTPQLLIALAAVAVVVALVFAAVVANQRRRPKLSEVRVDGLAHRPSEGGSSVRLFYLVDEERMAG